MPYRLTMSGKNSLVLVGVGVGVLVGRGVMVGVGEDKGPVGIRR